MLNIRKHLGGKDISGFEATSSGLQSLGATDLYFAAFFLDQRGNFGDRIIPQLATDLINYFLPCNPSYRLLHIRDGMTPTLPPNRSDRPKALIIGPGGLICGRAQGTECNKYKWFANISAQEVLELHQGGTKIFFWGTGVNRWSEKRQLTDEALEDIIAIFQCVDRAYIRGKADIEFLNSFLPKNCQNKLHYQICPSFFISELRNIKRSCRPGNRVALNIAADQLAELFKVPASIADKWSKNKIPYYRKCAELIRPLVDTILYEGFEPVFFCSTREDTAFAKKEFPEIERLDTNSISSDFIQLEQLLTSFRFALGMRLHAWLPFLALEIPSVFITPFTIRSSMPSDIGLAELYCPLNPDSKDLLAGKFHYLVSNEETIRSRIKSAKSSNLKLTQTNVDYFRNSIELM